MIKKYRPPGHNENYPGAWECPCGHLNKQGWECMECKFKPIDQGEIKEYGIHCSMCCQEFTSEKKGKRKWFCKECAPKVTRKGNGESCVW